MRTYCVCAQILPLWIVEVIWKPLEENQIEYRAKFKMSRVLIFEANTCVAVGCAGCATLQMH